MKTCVPGRYARQRGGASGCSRPPWRRSRPMADLLSLDERNAIERLVADTSAHLQGTDIVAVRAATEALVAGTDDFAARRMDRSIRGALAGARDRGTGEVALQQMPKITVLPHEELCPAGTSSRLPRRVARRCAAGPRRRILNTPAARLRPAPRAIASFARDSSPAARPKTNEEDLLDRAWGLTPVSRLSCQAIVQDADLTVEIPSTASTTRRRPSSHAIAQVDRRARNRHRAGRGTPDVDPRSIRFTDLYNWVLALDSFDDDPKHSARRSSRRSSRLGSRKQTDARRRGSVAR